MTRDFSKLWSLYKQRTRETLIDVYDSWNEGLTRAAVPDVVCTTDDMRWNMISFAVALALTSVVGIVGLALWILFR